MYRIIYFLTLITVSSLVYSNTRPDFSSVKVPAFFDVRFKESEAGDVYALYRRANSKEELKALKLCRNMDGSYQKFTFFVQQQTRSLSIIAEGVNIGALVDISNSTICKKEEAVSITGNVLIENSEIYGGTIRTETENEQIFISNSSFNGEFLMSGTITFRDGVISGDPTILAPGIMSAYGADFYDNGAYDCSHCSFAGTPEEHIVLSGDEMEVKGNVYIGNSIRNSKIRGPVSDGYIDISESIIGEGVVIEGSVVILNSEIAGESLIQFVEDSTALCSNHGACEQIYIYQSSISSNTEINGFGIIDSSIINEGSMITLNASGKTAPSWLYKFRTNGFNINGNINSSGLNSQYELTYNMVGPWTCYTYQPPEGSPFPSCFQSSKVFDMTLH